MLQIACYMHVRHSCVTPRFLHAHRASISDPPPKRLIQRSTTTPNVPFFQYTRDGDTQKQKADREAEKNIDHARSPTQNPTTYW
ncbi:hypothetical protein XENTR_v10019662 [Xenopus tropicalis]|nr:hypothetical protein XENTR_v10019662 [Xenopus tropicalis]